MLLLCSRSRSSALFCSSRSRRRPARPCVRDALRRCPVIKSGAAMLLVAQGTAGGLSPQPLVLSPHRGRRLKGRSSRLGVRYGPQPAKAADASVRSPGAETAAQRLIAAGCRLPLTLRRNWTVIELAFAKEDHRISDTERAGLQCHGGCLRQRRATSVLCLSKFPCKNSQGPFFIPPTGRGGAGQTLPVSPNRCCKSVARVASEAFLLARNGLNLPPNRKEEPSFPHSISIVALRLAGARLSWSGTLVWLAGAAAKSLLPPVW
jgi:hypothetical protein